MSSRLSSFRVSVTPFLVLLALSTGLVLSGCSETAVDKLADAQTCLDKYAQSGSGDLNACESKVDGMTTPAAYGIRCAAGFMGQGFVSSAKFTAAFNAISTVSASSVADFLSLMTFQSEGATGAPALAANYDVAKTIYGNCALSLGKAATLLATFSTISNALFNYNCVKGGTCSFASSNLDATFFITAGLDGTATGDNLKIDIGSVVVSTYDVSCSTGNANDTLCNFMKRAIDNAGGPGDKKAVGVQFLVVLASP